jgi:hypothetical protein
VFSFAQKKCEYTNQNQWQPKNLRALAGSKLEHRSLEMMSDQSDHRKSKTWGEKKH